MPKRPKPPKTGAISTGARARMIRRQENRERRAAEKVEKSEVAKSETRKRKRATTGVHVKARIGRLTKFASASAIDALATIVKNPEVPAKERVAAANAILEFVQPRERPDPRQPTARKKP